MLVFPEQHANGFGLAAHLRHDLKPPEAPAAEPDHAGDSGRSEGDEHAEETHVDREGAAVVAEARCPAEGQGPGDRRNRKRCKPDRRHHRRRYGCGDDDLRAF